MDIKDIKDEPAPNAINEDDIEGGSGKQPPKRPKKP